MSKTKIVKAPPANLPVEWENVDAYAIQALANGTANASQQIHALKWIVERASDYDNMSYRPDSERETVFAEGRRFVGQQIIKLTKLNMMLFSGKNK